MSYLDNGSTLRAMFRLMPPMRHDADPTRSDVVAHIRENLRCELGRAIRAFDSMRHLKSAVLIYDRIHRQWRGCDWVPAEEVDKISLLMSVVTELKRDISSLRSELRKVKNEMVSLRRRNGGRKDEKVANSEDDLDPEPKPEQQQAAPPEEKAADPEEWFRAMRVALYGADTASPSSAPLP
jgi:FtsZ-binding cell division protein ZapB